MSKPRIDAAVIGRLRALVIDHNQAAAQPVRLGELRKVFQDGWRGQRAEERAWMKVNQHLAKLAKAAPPGAGEFDPGEHPRDERGQFRRSAGGGSAGGGGAGRRQPPPAPPPAPAQANNDPPRPIQVIPETRFTTFGPSIAAGLGLASGALAGAAPDRAREGDKVIGRAIGRGVGFVAGTAARGGAAVYGAASDFLNERKPSLANDARAAARSARAHKTAAKWAGWATERGYDLASRITLAPAQAWHRGARAKIERSGATGATRALMHGNRVLIGAALGAAIPGALIARTNYLAAQAAGPYLDAAMPRRVEKLAKVAATPASSDLLAKAGDSELGRLAMARLAPPAPPLLALAKVKATEESAELLAKLSFSEAGRAARQFGRHMMSQTHMGRPGAVVRRMGHAIMAPKRNVVAGYRNFQRGHETFRTGAHTSFGNAGNVTPADPVNRAKRIAQGRLMGGAAYAAGGIGGAALGAGLGAAAGWGGSRVYYRDEHGKFTSKDRAVVGGALAGAAAGALAGLSFIRGGNRRILNELASGAAYGRPVATTQAPLVRDPLTGRMKVVGGQPVRANAETPRTLSPAMVAARAKSMAESRAMRARSGDIARRKALAQPKLDALDAAAKDPVSWNNHQVRQELDQRLMARFSEPLPGAAGHDPELHRFWEAKQGNVRARVLRHHRNGIDPAPHLNEAQKAEVAGLRQQAQQHMDEYAGQVRALHEKVARHEGDLAAATEKRIAAEAEHTRLKQEQAALHGKTDDESHLARGKLTEPLIVAESTVKAAQREAKAAERELNTVREVISSPDHGTFGSLHPKPKDPWTGMERARALPTETHVQDLRQEIEGQAAERAKLAAATRGAEVQAHAEEIATKTAEALRGLGYREPGAMANGIAALSARLARPMRDAGRDLALAGGEVGRVIDAYMGNAPSRMAGYAKAASTRATNFVAGTPNAAGKREGGVGRWLLTNHKPIVGVGLAAAAGGGLVEYDHESGVFTPKVKTAAEALKNLRAGTRPVYRVFNPGDSKNQVILTGVVSRDKKTGQSIILAGTLTRSTLNGEKTEQLPVNARLEDVIKQIRGDNRQQQQGQKPQVKGLNDQERTTAESALRELRNQGKIATFGDGDASFEHRTDNNVHQDAANRVQTALFKTAGEKGGNFGAGYQPGDYYEHLREIIDGAQSPLLTVQQRRTLLLGGGDQKSQKGLFSPAVRSAVTQSNGQSLFAALKAEFGNRKVPFGSDETDKALRAAVAALNHGMGDGRRMTDDEMAQIDGLISNNRRPGGGGNGGQQRQQQGQQQGQQQNSGGGASAGRGGGGGGGSRAQGGGQRPKANGDAEQEAMLVGDFQGQLFDQLADKHGAHGLDDVAEEALRDMIDSHWQAVSDRLKVEHPDMGYAERAQNAYAHVKKKMDAAFARASANKAAPMGALRKFNFDESKHQRAGRGSDHGGEFTAGRGAGQGMGRGADGRQARPQERSYFEPVRLGGTVGEATGSAAGWELASRYLPPGLQGKGIVGKIAVRLAASMAGGFGGRALGEAAGRRSYGPGQRAPASWEAPPRSLGEEGSRMVGSIAGWETASRAGQAALGAAGRAGLGGNPLVGISLGTVGQLGGEELAAAAYRVAHSRFGSEVAAAVSRALGHGQNQTSRA